MHSRVPELFIEVHPPTELLETCLRALICAAMETRHQMMQLDGLKSKFGAEEKFLARRDFNAS